LIKNISPGTKFKGAALNKKMKEVKDPQKSNDDRSIRQPWISRGTGFTAITVISVAMAIWTAWQNVSGGGSLWNGILWGLAFGASIWLVFFGMNYFHSLFNGTHRKKEK
jgi:hypothetical protein